VGANSYFIDSIQTPVQGRGVLSAEVGGRAIHANIDERIASSTVIAIGWTHSTGTKTV